MVDREAIAESLAQELEYVGDNAVDETSHVDEGTILITLDNGQQFAIEVTEVD